jgi:hypothetical protein
LKAKSLVVAALLLLAYQSWLNWARPLGNQTLTFGQSNMIRAQRYVHDFHDPKVMFCGSSLTYALEHFLIQRDPREVGCLALIALGALDGLEMVERTGARPTLLMLEMNHLNRKPDRAFLDELFRPGMVQLRGKFSALRHGYQPANLLIPWQERGFQPEEPPQFGVAEPKDTACPAPSPVPARRPPQEVEEVSQAAIDMLPGLRLRTEKLRQLGVRVGFYEVPEHIDVTRSLAMQRLRDALKITFPEHQYGRLIRDPDTVYYTDRDGEHLNREDASAFAHFLLAQTRLRLAQGHP